MNRAYPHKLVHDIIKHDKMLVNILFQTKVEKGKLLPDRVEIKFVFFIHGRMESYVHAENFKKDNKFEKVPGLQRFPYVLESDGLVYIESLLRSIGFDKRQLCEPNPIRMLVLKKCAELFGQNIHYE